MKLVPRIGNLLPDLLPDVVAPRRSHGVDDSIPMNVEVRTFRVSCTALSSSDVVSTERYEQHASNSNAKNSKKVKEVIK